MISICRKLLLRQSQEFISPPIHITWFKFESHPSPTFIQSYIQLTQILKLIFLWNMKYTGERGREPHHTDSLHTIYRVLQRIFHDFIFKYKVCYMFHSYMSVIRFFFIEKLRDLAHYQFIYAIFSILLEFNKKRLNLGTLCRDDSLHVLPFFTFLQKNGNVCGI